jgi:hypothetical protein
MFKDLMFGIVKALLLWCFIAGLLSMVTIPLAFVFGGFTPAAVGAAIGILVLNILLMVPFAYLSRRNNRRTYAAK